MIDCLNIGGYNVTPIMYFNFLQVGNKLCINDVHPDIWPEFSENLQSEIKWRCECDQDKL
jgi:hypothetical protein